MKNDGNVFIGNDKIIEIHYNIKFGDNIVNQYNEFYQFFLESMLVVIIASLS